MDFKLAVYKICNSYVSDRKSTIKPENYAKISGWIRSRSLDKLATCTSLSSPALSGKDEWETLMQIEAFYKKNAIFVEPDRCEAAALQAFERGERVCRITNRRLYYYYKQRDRLDPDLLKQIEKMKQIVRSTLGPITRFYAEIPRRGRVTSGATATMSRKEAVPYRRLSTRPRANPRTAPYFSALCEEFGYQFKGVRALLSNRLDTVPKNYRTHRTIACEPEGNAFLQLAFDSYVKDRLRKKLRINLRSQFRNQQMAFKGSVDGSYSTIDLEMASDTVSFNVVSMIFPGDWFEYLNRTRSVYGFGFTNVKYAKFSSMGNGATFGIETLLFAAACKAVGSEDFTVYGDDIVIETHNVDRLLKLLKFLGFKTNETKSFIDGPFRESCGTNWFQGCDITPVYIRKLDKRKAVLCHLVNSLLSISTPNGHLHGYLSQLVVDEDLPIVPYGEGTPTTQGVWSLIDHCRGKGLLRKKNFQPQYKGYSFQNQLMYRACHRSLFLWYFDILKGRYEGQHEERERERFSSRFQWETEDNCVVRSGYTMAGHKYVRKWFYWIKPVTGEPLHLYWWRDPRLT